MKTRRTREVIIEIERVRIVSRDSAQTVNYCRRCSAEKEFVNAAEAARIIETDAQTIFNLAEAGVLHSFFAGVDETYVCLASLLIFEANRFR